MGKAAEFKERVPDAPASTIRGSDSQFADLHDRLTVMQHQLNIMFSEITQIKNDLHDDHEEVMHSHMMTRDDVNDDIRHILETVVKDVVAIREDLEGKDYSEHLSQLHLNLHESYAGILDAIPHHVKHGEFSPSIGI